MNREQIVVVVVDDDLEFSRKFSEMLRAKGYSNTIAANGKEAFGILKEDKVDVVMTDLTLEDMSGLEVMKVIQELSPGTECILLTGYGSQKSAIKTVNLGAYDYVREPSDVEQLLVTIGRAVEKRDAQEALREYEERFKWMAENTKEVFWMTDPQSIKIIYISPSYQDVWQRPLDALYKDSRKGVEYIHEDDIEMVRKNCRKHGQGHSTYMEFRIILPDGTSRWIANRSQPIKDNNDRICKVMGIAEDITDNKQAMEERVKLETLLRQSQKMVAMSNLVGRFAHNFNNMLSAIIGYTELSMMKTPKDCAVFAYLNEVYRAGNRAKKLVAQILTFNRQRERELKPVMVKPIVKEGLKFIRTTLSHTVEIHQDIRSDSMALGDSTQIREILMYLCSNAGRTMDEEGGILRVELVDMEIDSEFTKKHTDIFPGSYVKLTVSDTGPGISPHALDRTFDPFFATNKRENDTDMFLSVANGIVQSYGGAMYSFSKLGEGSAFEVYLPAIEGRPEMEGQP